MKLESIYNILKESSLSDFYVPSGIYHKVFIYKEDIGITISQIDDEERDERFGYDYFFDNKGNEIELNDEYDKLIKKLCELKNFPETYNSITMETWVVKYNNQEVYYINCMNISNLSSLYVSLPISLNTFDFMMNFCKLHNDYQSANTMYSAEREIESVLNIRESTYDDFLDYR